MNQMKKEKYKYKKRKRIEIEWAIDYEGTWGFEPEANLLSQSLHNLIRYPFFSSFFVFCFSNQ